jgi:hypothetical protein|nr:MAG TPA: hypothetical protein [Caudoviricetes sp.]DAZ84035.1 MAG TPA: hypothetical protein [Caudoviricetes sp.]
MNNQKFIVTKDKATAEFFIASGIKLVSQIGDTYTFLNQPPKHFSFRETDKGKYCFSNILSM